MRPEISLRLLQENPPHSRAETIIRSESSMLVSCTSRTAGRGDVWKAGNAIPHGGIEWLGRERPPMLLTTISVPRAFNPTCQLFSKPRDIPTNATTAAMPMEMPHEGQAVRIGRRSRPRMTTEKNVICRLRRLRRVDPRRCGRLSCRSVLEARAAMRGIMRDQHQSPALLLLQTNDEVENQCAFSLSRLPVGSSASSTDGPLARLRAMATRCRSPPESLEGK